MADYYLAGIGDAIAVAMPPGRACTSVGVQDAPGRDGDRPRPGLGGGQAPADLAPGLTPKQRAALDILAAAGVGLPLGELRDRGVTSGRAGRLAARGLVTLRDEADERDPFERAAMPDRVPDPARELTPEQRAAFEQLAALAEAGELPDRAAARRHRQRQDRDLPAPGAARSSALAGRCCCMVPEIALTPSVAALFRGAFGDRVAIQHSALSDGERHDQWQRIRRGDVDVVVGTRSAVFAPLTRLGLDHRGRGARHLLQAGGGAALSRPRRRDRARHARRRARRARLGDAVDGDVSERACPASTRSATLERRVLDRPLAAVRIVNMRDEYAEEGPDVVISRDLAAAIADRLARREQVLVLLNRRGYATAVFCRQCGDTFECPNCSISLTVHRARNGWRARCHYCNYSMMVPKACRKCAAPYLEHAGFGTEKVEEQLAERFPTRGSGASIATPSGARAR